MNKNSKKKAGSARQLPSFNELSERLRLLEPPTVSHPNIPLLPVNSTQTNKPNFNDLQKQLNNLTMKMRSTNNKSSYSKKQSNSRGRSNSKKQSKTRGRSNSRGRNNSLSKNHSIFINRFRGDINVLKNFIIELLLYFALNETEQKIWSSLVKIIMFDYRLLMLAPATGLVHPMTADQRTGLLDAAISDPEYTFIEIDEGGPYESEIYKKEIELKKFIDSISTNSRTIAGSTIRGTFDFLKNFVLRILKYLDDNNKTNIVNRIKSYY